jgi:hypothetical protein
MSIDSRPLSDSLSDSTPFRLILLARLPVAWPALSGHLRAAILALVSAIAEPASLAPTPLAYCETPLGVGVLGITEALGGEASGL